MNDKLLSLVKTVKSTGKGLIVVTSTLPKRSQMIVEELQNSGNENLKIVQWTKNSRPARSELLELVKGASGVLCMLTDKIDDEFLDAAGPQLKIVSSMSVGYDHIDVSALNSRNVLIGNTPGVLTDASADITAFLALAAARRAKEGHSAVEGGTWKEWHPTWLLGQQFSGKTLGIVGLGQIGCATAARMIPFGFKKILYSGTKSHPDKEALLKSLADANFSITKLSSPEITNDFSIRNSSLSDLLKESDVVCITCSLNKSTYHLINKDNIKLMKNSATLVNSARGPIVDQEALFEALESGSLFAAGLDVTVPEPIPSTHPLVKHPRCFIIPHVASATIETRTLMSDLALENLFCGLLGQSLKHQVHN
ncbi:hypothetical protein BB559_004614 [Furculomyces boomerangus]|uniref:Glyoxylate reductase n=2 Tax=Harpellales TaxID=61421 RepID=A0A2T9YDS3_9FUNG|nr:hypothetical protein BB559_004614 [Furculomyces boomerangus]PVZ98463.1 hypothetical protein BB558_005540 [Smittium angustum]